MGGEKHFEYDALGHVTKVVDEMVIIPVMNILQMDI